jgi:hypothetical protein
MKTNSIFKTHPQLPKCFVTSDGTAFYKATDAANHASTLKDKSVKEEINQTLEVGNTTDVNVEKKAIKNTDDQLGDLTPMQKAKLRIEANDALTTVEEVKVALKDETAKSVIKAGEARIAALESLASKEE